MAQREKVSAAKLGDINSIPRIDVVVRTRFLEAVL